MLVLEIVLLFVPYCVLGLKLSASVESLVKDQGYPFEQHSVVTEDGYIITLHRIPYGRNHTGKVGRPVIVQHGILCSSTGFLLSRPDKALGFVLADQGFDVWLPNNRGNIYSRMHKNLSIHSPEYWDFSFHEIGYYDLPACIEYILRNTGYSKLEYIGHSQGTTIFFVLAATRPEYNQKISYMSALAPIVFLDQGRGFIKGINSMSSHIELICKLTGIHEFLPNSWFIRLAMKALCERNSFEEEICGNVLSWVVGYDEKQWNATLQPIIDTFMPAGASMKQMFHLNQISRSDGKYFRMYDYGNRKNLEKYHQRDPPDYDLSKISIPVTLHYAENDWLSSVKGVMKLNASLPNSSTRLVPLSSFNHVDFMWAKDVNKLLYDDLIKFLKNH